MPRGGAAIPTRFLCESFPVAAVGLGGAPSSTGCACFWLAFFLYLMQQMHSMATQATLKTSIAVRKPALSTTLSIGVRVVKSLAAPTEVFAGWAYGSAGRPMMSADAPEHVLQLNGQATLAVVPSVSTSVVQYLSFGCPAAYVAHVHVGLEASVQVALLPQARLG